jgi:hypothetical protein
MEKERPSGMQNPATGPNYCGVSIVLQLVRPDIRQSCILLLAVSSWASQSPTTNRTTAMANPAIAGRRFSPWSGSVIVFSVLGNVLQRRYYHDRRIKARPVAASCRPGRWQGTIHAGFRYIVRPTNPNSTFVGRFAIYGM